MKARGRVIGTAAANGGKVCKFTAHDEEYCASKDCEGNDTCSHMTCHVVDKNKKGMPCTPDPDNVDVHGQPLCVAVMEIRHQGVKRCTKPAGEGKLGAHCIDDEMYHPELRESKEIHSGHHCQRTGSVLARTCECHCYDLPPKPEDVVTPRVAAP